MKVYCKNCKYNKYGKYCVCGANYGMTKYISECMSLFANEVTENSNNKFNKDGECKNYKRKWWKFLIKPTNQQTKE